MHAADIGLQPADVSDQRTTGGVMDAGLRRTPSESSEDSSESALVRVRTDSSESVRVQPSESVRVQPSESRASEAGIQGLWTKRGGGRAGSWGPGERDEDPDDSAGRKKLAAS